MFKTALKAELNWNEIKNNYDHLALFQYFYPKAVYNKLVFSPFRNEKYPSFIINYAPNGALLYKDFGNNDTGDILKFIRRLHNINYIDAIKLIHKISISNNLSYVNSPIKTIVKPPTRDSTIYIKECNYSLKHIAYWKEYNISFQTLIKYNVKCLSHAIVIKDKENYTINSPLIFCYTFDDRYKLYMPNSNNSKFISTMDANDIEGFSELPWVGEFLIITSSMKDVMALYEIGFPAVSLGSESRYIPDWLYKNINKRFENIYTLYDYDETGIKWAEIIKEHYNYPSIFTYNANQKDPSDFSKHNGLIHLQALINSQL